MRLNNWLASGLLMATVTAIGCQGRIAHNLPPASRLMEPGPGVGGPGPGVIPPPGQFPGGAAMMGGGPGMAMGGMMDPNIMQAQCVADYGGGDMSACGVPGTSQIAFLGEAGLQINWDVSGHCLFDSTTLVVPNKQDFAQAGIYRLKLTNISGRDAIALYPTLEVAPVTPRTDAYLAHSPIPIQFTEEDFDQVTSGNFVTKVVYLPDPEFQELALAGVETLVSTRLDPGDDPIAKADQRGSILAILRMGNKDLEASRNAAAGASGVSPAQYEDGQTVDGGMVEGEYTGEQYSEGGYSAGCAPSYGAQYGGGYGGGLPLGAPTAGFNPQALPPHMIANMTPQYGMPITGTPIGLPGPPHIPLGVPAGLQSHTMTNRTRMHLPPPTERMHISVKQRPGNDYPRPVQKIHVDEVNRAPFKLFHGSVPGVIPSALRGAAANAHGAAQACDDGYCR